MVAVGLGGRRSKESKDRPSGTSLIYFAACHDLQGFVPHPLVMRESHVGPPTATMHGGTISGGRTARTCRTCP